MPDTTAHLALPFIMAAQAQKHVTHNEALRLLDAVVQLAILDRDLTAPPASPAEGARYIVASGAAGVWAGWDLNVALWVDGAWMRLVPEPGWIAWIVDEGGLFVWSGSAWAGVTGGDGGGSDGTGAFDLLGIGGATPDATNVLAVAAAAVLLNNAGAGIQLKLNKAAAGDTASLLFQDGWSGRAEMGLAGTDDFSVKVSNGSSWFSAMVASGADGRIAFPSGVVGLATSPFLVPVSGSYVQTANRNGAATATQAGVADRMDVFPWLCPTDLAIDQVAINVTTAVASAAGKVVIYASDANGRPDALIAETGSLDLSSTGPKADSISLSLKGGMTYWLGIRHSSTATISSWQAYTTPDLPVTAVATTAAKVLRRSLAFATAAPGSWDYSAGEATNGNAPSIWLRAA